MLSSIGVLSPCLARKRNRIKPTAPLTSVTLYWIVYYSPLIYHTTLASLQLNHSLSHYSRKPTTQLFLSQYTRKPTTQLPSITLHSQAYCSPLLYHTTLASLQLNYPLYHTTVPSLFLYFPLSHARKPCHTREPATLLSYITRSQALSHSRAYYSSGRCNSEAPPPTLKSHTPLQVLARRRRSWAVS